MKSRLLAVLKRIGKSDKKVAAVFAFDRAACHKAVLHLREGAPEVPVFLFTTVEPSAETAALCETIVISRSSLALLFRAHARLWKFWVALSLTTWTGGHGKWPLKLAPFLIPPFRALILNRTGDFFPGTPGNVLMHVVTTSRGGIESAWYRTMDISRGVWYCGPVTRMKDLSRGLAGLVGSFLLLALSTLLKWCAYPDRLLFERLHGCETLDLPDCEASGDDIAVFHHSGRWWKAAEFERFVRCCSTRYILWCEPGADYTASDMLLPFRDKRDFAAAMQWSARDWKPMLFASAPFRMLQRGEASRVFAPVSSAILVDREKLLALGIPHASFPGAAWLIIFWKAAAAGLRSYRVGQELDLRRQPDFPMQERSFILRVLADRSLRRLGPKEADLTRGSIAMYPGLQPPPARPGERLTVLLVSPFLPYPLSHGGAVRIYNMCLALRDRVDFILIALREKNEYVDYPKLHEIFREVYIVDKDEHALRDHSLPAQVREHPSRSLRALIADLAGRCDILQIEYTHMAAFRDSAPGIPAILVEHDLTFSLYRQLAESKPGRESRREYERWLEFERRWLSVYDGVWTVSGEDRESAIREGRRDPELTFSVPNGVDTERFAPVHEPTEFPEIFYVGSFRHLPNILGFEKLRREVMPRVWKSFPEARLRVVAGPRHEDFWKEFARKENLAQVDRRIVIHGFVADLRPLYAKAAVVVAPLEVSAGTNIKVLEAMACGKVVVSTPVGCAGLGLRDGEDAMIRTSNAELADGLCQALADAELRSRIGCNARQTVERRFSWTAIAESAYASYLALARQRG